MSPVTPKPAAEFSTLAMTKSMSRCSTSAGMARRAISRPGLPKMSPMKRMRTSVGPHANANARRRAVPRCAAGRTRSSPALSVASARPASNAPASRTPRANRPNARSARWKAARRASQVAGRFWPTMTSVLRTNRTFTESGVTPAMSIITRMPSAVSTTSSGGVHSAPAASRPSSSRSNKRRRSSSMSRRSRKMRATGFVF